MTFFGREFRAAWWSVALTAAGMSLFASLGYWQLERANHKDSIQQIFELRLGEAYQVPAAEVFEGEVDTRALLFRKLVLTGDFDTEHSFLLDNQLRQGRAGFHVLTPFRLADSERVILVNRGWVELGESRERLPEISSPLDPRKVSGIISLPETSQFQMGELVLGDNWPQIIPFIDLAALRKQYSQQLLPMVLWMGPEQPGFYSREWNPVWMKPEKSRAYATQWFSFALVAFVLFIILNLRKPQ